MATTRSGAGGAFRLRAAARAGIYRAVARPAAGGAFVAGASRSVAWGAGGLW